MSAGVRMALLAGCLFVALLALPSLAFGQDGDDWTAPTQLTLDSPRGLAPNPPDLNLGYTVQTGEPLTPGNGTCGGVSMVKTHWYRFTADGLRTTVSTAGSSFDTVIEAYQTAGTPTFANSVEFCSDDVSSTDHTSRLSFDTVRGATYLVQVGGCSGTGCGADEGAISIVASTPPTNDNRANPETVGTGAQVLRANRYAPLESGEAGQCGRPGGGGTN